MLDDKARMMLEVANQLTTDDIEFLKGGTPIVPNRSVAASTPAEPSPLPACPTEAGPAVGSSRGEYEQRRTRESKVSTVCVGTERAKHDWWPIGTHLVGRIRDEEFMAQVVENPAVKSGRSILITSGSAQGKVCITPTRAALQATEDYRQANNLGRGGGVTNGWTFWKPKPNG
jgi:hypothetical protein